MTKEIVVHLDESPTSNRIWINGVEIPATAYQIQHLEDGVTRVKVNFPARVEIGPPKVPGLEHGNLSTGTDG